MARNREHDPAHDDDRDGAANDAQIHSRYPFP
jgi:hypothetical protein